ncbi:EF-hand and coiled-coil domain-containing protein 1 isoform X3 [Alligator mississippiensis]|uniref:EF-hand and coiled-coil domain-containing protein 1 isoform X3 n=1 Tax=Alligator mississippiensis TaxID=8496 RepID=UPI0028777BF1|nr:EF-hand and coiled-coil domain-containing protein 1 isoform X3 [Alligator mississippiensis]
MRAGGDRPGRGPGAACFSGARAAWCGEVGAMAAREAAERGPEPEREPDPYRRPARRMQWLVSALAYHYGLDRGVENEIVVLATGLDQYLQEVFHHLDCAGDGRLPREDFQTLCHVLGLRAGTGTGAEEDAAACRDVSAELTFRQFHARLCGYFSTRAGCPPGRAALARLPVGEESEHIETQIRLRSPLRRRRGRGRGAGGRSGAAPGPPGACSRECYEEIVALEQAEDRIAKLEDENASLRELVEDLRAALQSSDARCLALQVGLRKSHADHKKDGTCFIGNKTLLTQNNSPTTKCIQSVLKEVELLRSSRDGQIEEAIRFNQELERELRSSQEAVVTLEDCNRNLKKEQAEMRKKVEEARYAVLNSLEKVKELEAKANEVPQLQTHIQQLESELQYYRSEVMKLQLPSRSSKEQNEGAALPDRKFCLSVVHQDRGSPAGGAGISENVEDQMFRSVEGQAASDEEEEKWTGEQPSQVAEVKKLLTRLPCCGSGCDDKMLKKLMSYFGDANSNCHENATVELVERTVKLTEQPEHKGNDTKTLETNVEENISKRALGKILLSTLESCQDNQHGKAHIFEVLDTLYQELAASELLQSQSLEKAQSHQSLSNPLVISC